MDQFEQARRFFLQALEHHNHQRLTEAEALYRQALALVPERISVLNNLAAVLIGQSRFSEALAVCERALTLEPEHPDSVASAAMCRRELASPDQALRLLDAAVEAAPDDIQAHGNRAGVLQRLGRFSQALASYDRLLALDPGNVTALVNRGQVLARLGRVEEALACHKRALSIDPQFHQAGEGFIWLVLAFGYLPPQRDSDFESLVIRAIDEPWARPVAVAPVLQALLSADRVIGACIERAARSWPAQLPLDGILLPSERNAVAGSRLLKALLENAVVTDLRIEQWLGMLRAGLMERSARGVDADTGADEPLALHCALARQCFINQYVCSQDAEEHTLAEHLRERLVESIARDEPIPASVLVSVASYFPLSGIPGTVQLLQRSWPASVEALLTQQVREPLQERTHIANIARLTGIADQVSQQVKRQYEENPYPRWVATPRVHRNESLQAYLRRRVPGDAWRCAGDGRTVEALNAGCGTGQSPIESALRIAHVNVLAVDLSLASLGYGARMAERLGLTNIEFAQADILELATTSRRFDLIESTGVLHHLQDPAQGLRVLASLLNDTGLMKLALYSQTARRSVIAARALIQARGYSASQTDIRSCREAIMRMDTDAPEHQVTRFSDFHSLSECRDLLFHVQEHRFTIPEIRALLASAGLDFVGFEQDDSTLQASPPNAPPPNSLDGWDAFEHRHPDTFAGMYQFWVQKSVVTPAHARPK